MMMLWDAFRSTLGPVKRHEEITHMTAVELLVLIVFFGGMAWVIWAAEPPKK